MIGLRFDRRDAVTLRGVAQSAQRGELGPGQPVSLYVAAANAAATGEPMELHCSAAVEAVMIAEAFATFGIRHPSVEQLSGRR